MLSDPTLDNTPCRCDDVITTLTLLSWPSPVLHIIPVSDTHIVDVLVDPPTRTPPLVHDPLTLDPITVTLTLPVFPLFVLTMLLLSLIHITETTRQRRISKAVFC